MSWTLYNKIMDDFNISNDMDASITKHCYYKYSHDIFVIAAYYGNVDMMKSIYKLCFNNKRVWFAYPWHRVQTYLLFGIYDNVNSNPINSLNFVLNCCSEFILMKEKNHNDEFGIEIIQIPLSDRYMLIINEEIFDDKILHFKKDYSNLTKYMFTK